MLNPTGEGYAYFLIDYGIDEDQPRICFINEAGECWTFRNPPYKINTQQYFR